MRKSIIMCPPTYFDVEYELSTNRWMDVKVRPDKKLAEVQWKNLMDAACKVSDVTLAIAQVGMPDLTFFANAGLSYKNVFIFSNFYHQERRPETLYSIHLLGSVIGGRKLHVVPSFFEGQGDTIVVNDNQVIIGCGIRTDMAGVESVDHVLKMHNPTIKVTPIPLRSQSTFYHLDTCCFYIPKAETFVVYEGAFLADGLNRLSKLGNILPVTYEESRQFVCNSVVMNDETIFMPWVNSRLKKKLSRLGYSNIQTFPMSEFIKSGGAVKCLILEM